MAEKRHLLCALFLLSFAMRYLSLGAVLVVAIALAVMRLGYTNWNTPGANVLTSDAFGYYLYLPGQYIYHDLTKLEWLPGILEKYSPTGHLYQVIALENGNFAMKYLRGLSILYTPFFFLGHWAAGILGYAQDGFSVPYPVAICFGAWVYALLGFLLLRKVLLRFFPEPVVAVTLLAVGLATNYPQYVAIDSAMSHGFLFTMYAFLLWLTVRWHDAPSSRLAFVLGSVIGLSCITRPTEGVMLFIPLLWKMPDGKTAWKFFRQHPARLVWALAGGFIGILPQLIYWKSVTGHWIFDVGSKFLFFRPHWQVLLGWEKGWFIYTPVTILMIAGLFFMGSHPFRKAVITFTLLNIWIVIAWSDWRYGASYSCRALIQSYPVLALPLALVVQKMLEGRRKYITFAALGFLIYLNLFQIWQYNRGILHYNDMNRKYYQAIFLDAHPTPLDMSLLDTEEIIRDESAYREINSLRLDSTYLVNKAGIEKAVFLDIPLRQLQGFDAGKEQWLRVTVQVLSAWGAFDTHLVTQATDSSRIKQTACRMVNGISIRQDWNTIDYYFRLPQDFSNGRLAVFVETTSVQDIYIKGVDLRFLEKK